MKRTTILVFLAAITLSANAQFFQGWGLMGGLSMGKQKWFTTMPDGATAKEKHKFVYRFNGELLAEFFSHYNFRWRTELQYNMKGTKYKPTGDKNKLDYICWNNFLMLRGETYDGYPYLLVGPRVEYLFKQSTPSVTDTFSKLHFTWSAGIGWEFITYSRLKPIIELHYNPAANLSYNTDLVDIKNRVWEIRVGFKIGSAKIGCPKVYR
jgi:hypothetical protein